MTDRLQDKLNEKNVHEQEEVFTVEDEPHGEAWQDDLPPEDDFHDIDAPEEMEVSEGLSSDEDYEPEDIYPDEGDAPEDDDGAHEANAKKRGKGVLLGVIAIGALLVGGMAYLQFGGHGFSMPTTSSLAVGEQPAGEPVDEKVASVAAQVQSPSTSSDSATSADISSLYNAAQAQAQGATGNPMPAELSGTSTDQSAIGSATEVMTLDDQPAAPSALPVVAPEATAPVVAKVEEIPMPTLQPEPELQKQVSVTALDVTPAPVPTPKAVTETVASAPLPVAPVAADSQVEMLTSQIDDLKASLEKARTENESLAKEIKTLSSAEQKVADYEKLQTRVHELEATIVKMKKAEKAMVSTPKSVKKTATVTKKTVKKEIVKAKPAKIDWVLRAATPDAAWVSKSDYAAELRRVAIGETLPGLGKIKAIRQSGDVWELVGTQGLLR